MGREQSFLDRLATLATDRRAPTAGEDVELLAESVRANLSRLLNSRHGMSEAAADYGLPSLTDLLMSEGSLRAVRETVRATIEKYEPRLRKAKVTPHAEEEDLPSQRLAFRIDAMLVGRTSEHQVWYMVQMSRAGDFEVTG